MKAKIIQILLGTVGSIVAVLIAHFAGATPDVVTAAAGGAAAGGVFGGVVQAAVDAHG